MLATKAATDAEVGCASSSETEYAVISHSTTASRGGEGGVGGEKVHALCRCTLTAGAKVAAVESAQPNTGVMHAPSTGGLRLMVASTV